MSNLIDYDSLEKELGYSFNDRAYLKLALTHSSYAHENMKETNGEYNERIEYLGDAVLELIVSDYLYRNYKNSSEGQMTKTRASLVCEYTLANCAREIKLSDSILLSNGEDMTGGRYRDSILSDAFESVLGAMYLDGGITPVAAFVKRILLTDIEHKELFYDAKTSLQEQVQARKGDKLEYVIVAETGPEHSKIFTAEARVNGKVIGVGEGKTKKSAEQHAAYQALMKMKIVES
ncbi:MAG: ribonuclease III [Lachnospiraceae bacterium]|nr:ribonuclease III [Lachnospiraceae bacterium]